jgi:hypothetical protein
MSCKRTRYAKVDESSSTGSYLTTHLATRDASQHDRSFFIAFYLYCFQQSITPTITECRRFHTLDVLAFIPRHYRIRLAALLAFTLTSSQILFSFLLPASIV